ncbi:MAG: AraC family transcriptional regulator [Polaribacter sp.]
MKKPNKIELVNFKSDILELGFEIVDLDYFYTLFEDERREKAHIINFYIIMFITNGKGKHQIDFNIYNFEKNNILFINKGQLHKWIDYKNAKGFLILFTETFLQKNQVKFKDLSYSFPYNSYLYKPFLTINKGEVNSIRTLISYLYEEYNSPQNEQKSEILQCLLRTFLLKIKRNKPLNKTNANAGQKELFIQFQKMIDDKINQSRNINDYCKWLSISYKKLNETSKTFTQSTAKNFLDQVLLLKAKQFLVDNKRSISEIAYLLSFEEPTNFTKFFKKHTTYSPKEFQKTVLSV